MAAVDCVILWSLDTDGHKSSQSSGNSERDTEGEK